MEFRQRVMKTSVQGIGVLDGCAQFAGQVHPVSSYMCGVFFGSGYSCLFPPVVFTRVACYDDGREMASTPW